MISKQFFCLRIDESDFALLIGDNHGIGRSFQQRAKFVFRPLLLWGLVQIGGAKPIVHEVILVIGC
jgi:hypothetical protein